MALVGVVRRLIRLPPSGSEYHAGNLPFSQKPGPTASTKSLAATKYPSSSSSIGSWGSGRVAGPKTGNMPSYRLNCDWWHGHNTRPVCCSYSETGQPTCVQILE